jgi:hypothetical protein
MSILLVTVDKGRPKAFDILQKVIAQQTRKDFHWLVVCDGWDGYKFPTKNCTVIKRDDSNDKLPSLNENWLVALDWIEAHEEYEKIIVIESDDFYHKEYVLDTAALLDRAELVGWEQDAYYYIMSHKARRTHNVNFAALASTAFTRSVVPYFRKCTELGTVFIDKPLWFGIKEKAQFAQPPMTLANGQVVNPSAIEYVRTVASFGGSKLLADNFTGIVSGQRRTMKWVDGKLHVTSHDYTLNEDGNIEGEHPRHVGLKEPWHGGTEGASDHSALDGGGPDRDGLKLIEWIGRENAMRYLGLFPEPDGRNGKPYPAFVLVAMPPEKDN